MDITTRREDYLVSALERMYWYEYYELHKAEINSTSPYAVTDKLPKMRIVDNPITEGSWRISPVHTTAHYGFFGGYKGSSMSGGGGGGSVKTHVQFDHISMCPVTGREFTDKELKKYHDDWMYQVESYARNEARRTERYEDPTTNTVRLRWQRGVAVLTYEQVEDLCMVNHSGEEVKKIIEGASAATQLD